MSSIYTNTPYTNIGRDPSYPYYYPHLNGYLPQTMYPYDSVYDNTYQSNIRHPKYRWYGNMEYPYFVRRHRIPKVFTEPKPTFTKANGFYHQIPSYPPYIYWYPNPTKCRDACGEAVCNEYFRRMNNYNMCQRCQTTDPPSCWNPKIQRCVPCNPETALEDCKQTYGCANPNGWPHRKVAPQNPLYTGCQLCK